MLKVSAKSKDILKNKSSPKKAKKVNGLNGKHKNEETKKNNGKGFHCETLYTKDKDIPKNLYDITDKNIFESLIYPMGKDEFFKNIFAKKAMVIKGASNDRFKTIVETQMYNLNLKKLAKNASSEQLHMWFPDRQALSHLKDGKNQTKNGKFEHKEGKEIKSFGTDDEDLALTSYYRGGASLYFGSTIEFRNLYCKALTYQMGLNFGAYYNDFSTMGEIEQFFSRKGNITSYHTDFQENFTLQIKGSKKWTLKRVDLRFPLLGYTPHYNQSGNIEGQAKSHLSFNGIEMNHSYTQLNKDTVEVVLDEGDIFYHPAGIWHEVECLSDESISINFSLRSMRVADLICNAQRMAFLKFDQTRQGVRLDAMQNFKEMTNDPFQLAKLAFEPKYLMPPSILIPRILNYDLDKTIEQNGKNDFKDKQVTVKTQFKLNPFFVITNIKDLPQKTEDLEDAQFVVNGLFGNDDFSSMVRVLMNTKSKDVTKVCDAIIKLLADRDNSKYFKKFSVEQLFKDNGIQANKNTLEVIRALIFNGVIVFD